MVTAGLSAVTLDPLSQSNAGNPITIDLFLRNMGKFCIFFFHNEFSPKPKENDVQIPVTVEVNVQFKRTVEMYFKKLLR